MRTWRIVSYMHTVTVQKEGSYNFANENFGTYMTYTRGNSYYQALPTIIIYLTKYPL